MEDSFNKGVFSSTLFSFYLTDFAFIFLLYFIERWLTYNNM